MHKVVVMLLAYACGVQLLWKDGLQVFEVQGVLAKGVVYLLGFP